jgi:ferric-dicitrate binding protein FerR (iron transport regulator)
MVTILAALAEAVGLGWMFRPLDMRPPHRRPHSLLRAAGSLLTVAVVAGLLWWYDHLLHEIMEFFARGGR